MQIDEVLQATLLLSCYFNKNEVKNIKPLTPTEYARFAAWLHQQQLTPADLLHDQSAVMGKWHDPKGKITPERINSLFSRGASMGFALEQWAKHGVWVISRPNVNYPVRLRAKFGDTRPPIFFGVGNQALLNQKGVGFVGSRSIDAIDESFAKAKAELAVSQGFMVISGGARGIDQTAMSAALDCGGESVGIIADSLLRASTAKAYRQGLKEDRLALISPFYPEAGFTPGNAMARNKYIYAMSEAVVVIKSDVNKGGTWTGAKENLNKRWVPLLVRDAAFDGNQALIKLGGIAIDESFDDFNQFPSEAASSHAPNAQPLNETEPMETGDMFGSLAPETNPTQGDSVLEANDTTTPANSSLASVESAGSAAAEPDDEIVEELDKEKDLNQVDNEDQSEHKAEKDEAEHGEIVPESFFDEYGEIFSLFSKRVQELGQHNQEIRSAVLLELYPELTKAIVEKWLKLLASEGYLTKEGRNLIYKITDKTII